ncbi:N-acetylmuramoyl-L-alanine amidase [Pseudotenacibaculum sp. MALMAid0570]|uniref:N-acetylmuramoyl-L-alanine amidase family protein n=1 Tax=Pseudotenacibaculum sp. MALMAid0570 TaxID=3143938 RepID=UPI0032DE2BE6
MLDAGHGGYEPGNIGNGYREKNIALKVVLAIGKELENETSIEVKYTRKKDVFIDLWKRGEIANKAKADLFVSIHCNAHNSNAYGTETFVLGLHANKQNFEVAKKENAVIKLEKNYKERYKGFDPDSPESILGLSLMQEENLDKSLSLAHSVQKNFRGNLKRRDRGVKQAGFIVLHQTYMPSVLIELGFLTNKNEGRYLNSKKGQQQMAKSIAKAIKKYINQLKLNTIDTDDEVVEFEEKESIVKDKEVKEDILFKIQIASSRKRIKTKAYNFKGLKNVERVKVGKYYKYYYGHSSNYNETKTSFALAKKKGYSSAFIVAFKNGEKVSLSEALK